MRRSVRVLIVDDSAVARCLLSDALARDRGVEVVGTAADARIAERKIASLAPDVVTLDVDMPGMDGLTFLARLMRTRPLPVVVISALTPESCEVTLRALELGAVDVVAKPPDGGGASSALAWTDLVDKVKQAAGARVRPLVVDRVPVPAVRPVPPRAVSRVWAPVIAVGASTGGTEAIAELLMAMPADAAPILIVQHMPRQFTGAFAQRCDARSAMSVREAGHGDALLPGRALIAPGDCHMRLQRVGAGLRVLLDQRPPVNRHRPSVDVLFQSVAETAARGAVGILLTGMGADGARGLLAMRRAGARTVAQDEQSCVVFGMPREAIDLGAAEYVLPLRRIPDAALTLCGSRAQRDGGAAHAVGR